MTCVCRVPPNSKIFLAIISGLCATTGQDLHTWIWTTLMQVKAHDNNVPKTLNIKILYKKLISVFWHLPYYRMGPHHWCLPRPWPQPKWVGLLRDREGTPVWIRPWLYNHGPQPEVQHLRVDSQTIVAEIRCGGKDISTGYGGWNGGFSYELAFLYTGAHSA